MTQIQSRVAAVTGAASGIGRALSVELADRGADLAVADVDSEGLKETAAAVREAGAECMKTTVDVSDREAVEEWAQEVRDQYGGVHIVVNNAGVSLSGSVEGMSYEDFEWLMSINFWGVVYGTRTFLPFIRESGGGRVVNMSSGFGIVSSPTQSAYNASKFAVRGFTEALRAELEFEDEEIGASCIHPGGVDTEIVRNARYADTGEMERDPEDIIEEFESQLARTSPAEAATTIADGIARDKGRILVGSDAYAMDLLQRMMPGSYPEWLARWISWSWED